MAFNSIISSMPGFMATANALGLGGLAGGDPSSGDPSGGPSAPSSPTTPGPPPAPKPIKAAPQTPREFRQHAPGPKAAPGGGRGLGLGQNSGMQMPGVMSPDVLMHPAVQQLLGQFGIGPEQLAQTAQNASPDLFITNPAAHANHPVLSGMLERGLEGLAFTQGGRTVGESISNVAKGMLDANAARAEKYNNQLMTPFQQASQVANLQGTNLHQQYEQAEAQRAEAQSRLYDQTPQMREDIANIGANQRAQAASGRMDMQRVANHLKLTMMPEFSQMTPEHSAALQEEIQKNGGDLGSLGDDRMEFYRQLGHADGLAANTKSKIQIRATPTTSNGRAGSMSPQDRQAFIIAGKEYSDAGRSLATFDKETNSSISANKPQTLNGRIVVPSMSSEWQADRAQKRAALDAAGRQAKQKYESFGQKNNNAAPSGNTPRTYNPVTGKIE